jgi:signal transduction histidine kinase
MATVVVADDGPGLPAEIRAAAARARPFASARPGGLGLGLDQARHTVERAGGRFDLVSAPGRGTSIALGLPALQHPETPAVELPAGETSAAEARAREMPAWETPA